jgi:hypothetical protein
MHDVITDERDAVAALRDRRDDRRWTVDGAERRDTEFVAGGGWDP